MEQNRAPVIGIVGPCAAGKTTLVGGLIKCGYQARHIAQEHSYVPYMWQRITNPRILVYLTVSYPVSMKRRKLNWTQAEYQIQIERLAHARQHANLEIDTVPLSPTEILDLVVGYLTKIGIDPEFGV